MSIKYGTVLVFKRGVTKAQAAEALMKIRDVIELPEPGSKRLEFPPGWPANAACAHENMIERPWKIQDEIEEFDDEYGGPVWYLP